MLNNKDNEGDKDKFVLQNLLDNISVFISMPSAPSGPWGGVSGIQKLVGVNALRRLEAEKSKRITKCAKAFIAVL